MKKLIKKMFVMSIVLCLSLNALTYAGTLVKKVYFSSFPIIIDGEGYSSETPILTYQNRTYVALREFSEMVGIDVAFENQQIYINTQSKKSTINVKKEENSTTTKDVEEMYIEKENNSSLVDNENNSKIVYISKSGTKYHILKQCNNATYYQISLNEALQKGYEPCLRCAK